MRIVFLLPILIINFLLPNTVNSENLFKDKRNGYDYGFYLGSFGKNCALYKAGWISEKQAQELFESDIRGIKKNVKSEYVKNNLLKFGEEEELNLCKKFIPKSFK